MQTHLSAIFLAALVMPFACGALTVRVDPAGGAPRLTVNGAPVPARMFWGAPGSAPINLTSSWQEVTFDFNASASATNGTLHFRFGHAPGDIFLDDIHVADLAGGDFIPRRDFEDGSNSFRRDWTFWPTGTNNTVGRVEVEPGAGRNGSAALHLKLTAPQDGKWPDFHIYHLPRLKITAGHRYRFSAWMRATPARQVALAFYQPGQTFTHLGGPPDVFGRQIELAAQAGVNFVSFPIAMPWPQPGAKVDWSVVDSACETVLRANSNALLIPRMGMDPPKWWRDANSNEVMRWEDGQRDKAVVASPLYRREAAERLAALVVHLEEKFGEHIAGYHPCGQNTGEWFYEDTWKNPLNGYAPADLVAWRRWLKQRHTNDAALRRAWSDQGASLDLTEVPPPAARHAAPSGIFRDPATERALIDWAEFQQEAMADCVLELARAARTASRGRKLVVFFYGYVFEFAAIQNGPAIAGHYALRRVLNSPDIDVLCSPISYFDRGLGQGAPSMTAAESVALAGKLWLNEDDTHTFLATGNQPGYTDHVNNLEDTNAQLARNVAQESIRNFGTWWMDLGSSGWFNDARMWTVMKQLRAMDEALLKTPTPFRPEIAAVIDERSIPRVAAGATAVTRRCIYEARAALGRMGAPYGQYLLDDVLAGRVRAKVFVFLNAWSLTEKERARLAEVTHGATSVWCYAPGYFDGDEVSFDAMRELTGFHLRRVSPERAMALLTEAGKKAGLTRSFGAEKAVEPLFFATSRPGDDVLATYPDGEAAVVLRRGTNGTSIFVGAPGLTSELLRVAARAAGAHQFIDADGHVYANGPFVALHAAQDGNLNVDLKSPGPVIDVFTGARVFSGPKFSVTLKRGETRVWRIDGTAAAK